MTKRKKWKQVQCHRCSGHGHVCAYTFDGSDFLGEDECSVCEGKGFIWKSQTGRLAVYPGGRFLGREAA